MARNLHQRNGVWVFRKEIDGKDWRVSTGFRDRKAAERRAAEIEVQIRSGKLGWTPPRIPTFGEWANRYTNAYSPRKRSHRRDYQVLAHAAQWEHRPLDAITRSECASYINRREAEGAAPGTIMREVGLLKAMFNAAIADGLIAVNSWKGIKPLRTHARQRVLSHDEQARLLSRCNGDYSRLITVALGAGLRANELLGLRPEDVDASSIRVRAESAKFGKARTVPLLPEVAEAIDRQTEARQCQSDDRLWSQSRSAVWRYLNWACRQAKVDHVCLHDLRRTFGTRCAVAGVPMPSLKEIMGHSSIEVTAKHYVHLKQRDLDAALRRVDLGLRTVAGTEAGTLKKDVA